MKRFIFSTAAFCVLLCFLSCQKEDKTKEYRVTFAGRYKIVSIYNDNKLAFDLNGDGNKSVNLVDEYNISNIPLSDFSFIPDKDGGYDGSFGFQCPLQALSAGSAALPYSWDTEVAFTGLFVSYVINFPMKLHQNGESAWEKVQEIKSAGSQIYTALLRDAELLKAENGSIDILIQEVPVYDCLKKELTSQTLSYHLEHE